MTELIVIRHGETDWNRQQRFQGQVDPPLNATGEAQAARLAAAMADEAVDVVVSSDLQRARQTAQPLVQVHATRALTLPAWREQAFGVLDGLSVAEVQARHPGLWAQWLRHDADFRLPEGESVREFHARVLGALRELVAGHGGQRVLIVTHGGVLDMLWRTVHGLPLHGPRDCPIPNTGVNRLRWRAGTLDIVRWADASHLGDLPEQPQTTPPAKR